MKMTLRSRFSRACRTCCRLPVDANRDREPDPAGAGEVLIEIAAAGLCHSDLSTMKVVRPRKVPTVVGHEAPANVTRGQKREARLGARDPRVQLLRKEFF